MKRIVCVFMWSVLMFRFTAALAQCTPTTVPYYENFSSISANNQLPGCWSSSSPSVTCLTYTAAQNQNRIPCSSPAFAAFYNVQGSHYFYSKPITLIAGVTYSTGLYYLTEYMGYTNWTDLSILYGSSQSSVGLTSVVSTNSAATSPVCKLLSGTFTATNTGVYYFAIRATTNGSVGATYLSWDDFFIQAPCQLNSAALTITASANTLCAGQSLTLTASATGANTYTWSTGSNSPIIVVYPNANTLYSANATLNSGCVVSQTFAATVNPSPLISIFALSQTICKGTSTKLTANGGQNYMWSNGQTTSSIVVSPSVNTTFSVIGTNTSGCTGSAFQNMTVYPLPNFTAITANTFICIGDAVITQLSGANSYTWSVNGSVPGATQNPIVTTLSANDTLKVSGTDANGCIQHTTINLNVYACAGILEKSLDKRLSLFPNPCVDYIYLTGIGSNNLIQLIDLKGQLVFSTSNKEGVLYLDLKTYAKGMYLLRVQSGNELVEKKIIKE